MEFIENEEEKTGSTNLTSIWTTHLQAIAYMQCSYM
jgi:hypothetical protein